MGLGQSNPGCNCQCGPPLPSNVCQEAGAAWNLAGVELTCPSFPLGNSYQCGPWGSGVRLRPNATKVRISFPRYYEPDFSCLMGIANGPGWSDGTYDDALGMWPVWTASNGNCLVGLANGYFTSGSAITYYPPYLARVNVGLDKVGNRFVMYVTLSAQVLMFQGNQFGSNVCAGTPYSAVLATGTIDPSANYYRSQFGLLSSTYTEKFGPVNRQSTFNGGWFTNNGYTFPQNYPNWCFGNCFYRLWNSASTYTVYLDDPNRQTTFDLWTPSPSIDPFGLTNGVSATISFR